MDKTVRVWDLNTGTERFTLTGHTSSVELLELSGSHLVSSSSDSTRVWDPDTGEIKHTLAAHTGPINCFRHDKSKVLSGSDGSLKLWDIGDGSVVRDLLTGNANVRKVAFEGRWCAAASSKKASSAFHEDGPIVIHVWDFGTEVIENVDGTRELRDISDRIGEPSNGFSDDTTDDEYEEEYVAAMDVGSLEIASGDRGT